MRTLAVLIRTRVGSFVLRDYAVVKVIHVGSNLAPIGATKAGGKQFNLQYRTNLESDAPWINLDGSHSDDLFPPSTREGLNQMFLLRAEAQESKGSNILGRDDQLRGRPDELSDSHQHLRSAQSEVNEVGQPQACSLVSLAPAYPTI